MGQVCPRHLEDIEEVKISGGEGGDHQAAVEEAAGLGRSSS